MQQEICQHNNRISLELEKDDKLRHQSTITKDDRIYEIAIMMKLGNDTEVKIDGNKTMEIYKNFCDQNINIWFSTDSHMYVKHLVEVLCQILILLMDLIDYHLIKKI
ncbi:hypothetical protein DVV95_11950 [Clostridium botulinum]|nr:hypothetical protein [Clostridium botulinum]